MRILFTKKNLDKKLLAEALGQPITYDLVDVIKTRRIDIEPFHLKDKSIIFTSVKGVESFFKNGFTPCEVFTEKNYNRIYCVGKKTKKEVRKYGYGTYKVKKHARDLAEFILKNSQGERFLHFCGNLALDVLDKALPLQNISYKKVPVYETILLYPEIKDSYDAVVFFSPSGVRSYLKNNSLENKLLFSIGQTTEKEIKKHTKTKVYSSSESNLEDLLKTILKHLK